MQRIGRASHQVDAVSEGIIFPKFRGDLVACAAVTRAMHDGQVEATRYPRNPLDVLAQQIVAMVAMDEWRVDDLFATVRSAPPRSPGSQPRIFEGVLDMLSGRYPSDEFAELRPRLTWDRIGGTLTRARRAPAAWPSSTAGRSPIAASTACSWPGAAKGAARVGELDEEMVFESRVGETFVLGASTWRIEDITHDRVLVSPAPGEPGKMPFWHGDRPGRPLELGLAIGRLVRELRGMPRRGGRRAAHEEHDLDRTAAENLLQYLARPGARHAGGARRPHARHRALPRRTRRLARLRAGAARRPGAGAVGDGGRGAHPRAAGHRRRDDVVGRRVRRAVPGHRRAAGPGAAPAAARRGRAPAAPAARAARRCSPPASARSPRGRCCCPAAGPARARRSGSSASGRRTCSRSRRGSGRSRRCSRPTASACGISSTCRRCVDVLGRVAARTMRVVDRGHRDAVALRRRRCCSRTRRTSSTTATRRWPSGVRRRCWSTSRSCATCWATSSCGSCSTPSVIDEVEAQLQHTDARYRAKSADGAPRPAAAGRRPGARRGDRPVGRRTGGAVDPGAGARRGASIEVAVAGAARFIAVEDAGRYRDAARRAAAAGLPDALLEPVADPLGDLVLRFARTHGPFTTDAVAARFGSRPMRAAARRSAAWPPEGRVAAGHVHARADRAANGARRRAAA